ncbi:MAG: DUF1801 domain-containing protein [Chitinophagaceae bacterium]
MATRPPAGISEYIASFSKEVQPVLQEVRVIVQKAAPRAIETIKYNMPTFGLDGNNLVHFAAFKHHIGFYPAPTGNPDFEKALAGYKTGRGSVQFPLDQPMPAALITRIVKWRMKMNREKAAQKKA